MLRAFFSIAAKLRAMMPWIKERAVVRGAKLAAVRAVGVWQPIPAGVG